jgi:predicted Fe-Mo cluster-binding NifX family protein
MFHCKQCRADAIGTLDNDRSVDLGGFLKEEKEQKVEKDLKFAIASKSGLHVDLHFGHAEEFYIYQYHQGEVRFLEKRNVEKYCTGIESCGETEDKITKIITSLQDCDGVIAMRIGEAPKIRLKEKGIQALAVFDKIESAVKQAVSEI